MSSGELKNVRRTYKCAAKKMIGIKISEPSEPRRQNGVMRSLHAMPERLSNSCRNEATQEDAAHLQTLTKLLADEPGPLCRERAIEIIIAACGQLCKRTAPHGQLTPDSFCLSGANPNSNNDNNNNDNNHADQVSLADPKDAEPGSFSVYAAPELFEGKPLNAYADVYSLGVILYEMMSNKNGSAAQLDAFRTDVSKWLAHSPIWSQTPSALKIIIRRSLHCEPSLRFRDAAELKRALENYLRPPKPVLTRSDLLGNTLAAVMLFLFISCLYQFSTPPAPLPVAGVAPVLAEPTPALVPFLFKEKSSRELPVPKIRSTPLSPAENSVLGKYELVILLDCSGSMTEFDCPLSGIITSRWDWASRELESFAKETSSSLPNGFSVITFSHEAQLFKNCHEKQLSQIFRSHAPGGDTQMDDAFRLALAKRYSLPKPLAVIVLTDGMPDDQSALEKDLVKAINYSKRDLRLMFLTVGSAPAGVRFLSLLNNNLASAGAKSDAVSTMPFKDLARMGLGHAIAQTVGAEESGKSKSAN